ncbi:MAG: ABC-2 family transporter protein [Oscillospiraceae bacterium]
MAFVTYQEWACYRTHSMVSIFVGPVYFLVQYFIWSAVYGTGTTLAGLELSQMVRYFGVTVLIGYLTMDFADWNLQMLIRTGKYLTFALRPVSHGFFAFSQKIGHRFLGFYVEFIPCFLIFSLLFGEVLVPAHIGWTVLSVALAFLMNFLVNYTLGMTAFWLVDANGIRHVFLLVSTFFSGGLVPLVFFPQWLQTLQFFLPFQYILYVPAMVWTGRYTLGGITLEIPAIVGIQACAVLFMALVSKLVGALAIRRFTGVGA